jgi:hypothetical protein
MNTNDLRRILCWLLRGHKWRRLRKSEGLDWLNADTKEVARICDRCGATRLAAKRKPKEQP